MLKNAMSNTPFAPASSRRGNSQTWVKSQWKNPACPGQISAEINNVFAHQKNRFGLFISTIGNARAEAKLILANIAYNFDRLIFHERARTMG